MSDTMYTNSQGFPQYRLDLPFDYGVEGYLYGYRGTFVLTYRDHPYHPFVVHEVGFPVVINGPRACMSGDYFEKRSDAFACLIERHTRRNREV